MLFKTTPSRLKILFWCFQPESKHVTGENSEKQFGKFEKNPKNLVSFAVKRKGKLNQVKRDDGVSNAKSKGENVDSDDKPQTNRKKEYPLFDKKPAIDTQAIDNLNVTPLREEIFNEDQTFEGLKIHDYITQYLTKKKEFTKPTTIQATAIPKILKGGNVMVSFDA